MRNRMRITMFSDPYFTGRIESKRINWTNYGVKNEVKRRDKLEKIS